jgi:hypothetical protein
MIIRAPGFAGEMEAISKKAAEQIVQYVKNSMDKSKLNHKRIA